MIRNISTGFVVAWVGLFAAPRVSEAAGEFVWPVTGRLTATTRYPGGANHAGASADIAAPMRRAIGASRAGNSSSHWEGGGCGWYAWITHPAGYITLYCHMVSRPTSGGVGTNQTIGYIGVTGNTTGPHVHWAIRRYGTRLAVPGAYIGMYVTRGARVPGTYSGLSGTSGTTTTTARVLFRARVTSGPLNVRTGPGTGYRIVGLLRYGTVVTVSAVSNGWYRISYGGYYRWIAGSYTRRV